MPGGCHQQVRLPAQEGRNLHHVNYAGNFRNIHGFVNVRQDRNADRLFHFTQYAQAFVQSRSAKALQ